MKNYAYLIQINSNANNNKFYEIFQNDDDTVSVKYGRVGGTVMSKNYFHSKDFWQLKEEKERKGYEDRTALHSNIEKIQNSELLFKPIENEDVQEMMELFINSSREFMKKNYTVSATQITQKMVDEAQRDIDKLNEIASDKKTHSLFSFNEVLEELFSDIPRRMGRVSDYLAKSESDFEKIINREQEMLNNVKGAVTKTVSKEQNNQDKTVLESFGLDIRPVNYSEEDAILKHLGHDYDGKEIENRYVKAFVVENFDTRKRYEQYKQDNNISNKNVKLFYHGSKVENWYSIIKQGLSLNPDAKTTGKMFGQGLYFAPESRKALNYMDVKGAVWNSGKRDTGYCAIYAVALGKSYEPNHILGSSFKGKDLPKGCLSVFASKHNPYLGLRNDEYIVYNQDACTIKYILEMSNQNVREKSYNLDRKVLRDSLKSGFSVLTKTDTGAKAELQLENLSPSAVKEITSKITKDYDVSQLYFDYNSKADRITLDVLTNNGESISIYPNITKDDYAFLTREMKKAFADSEIEWKEKLNKTSVGIKQTKNKTEELLKD